MRPKPVKAMRRRSVVALARPGTTLNRRKRTEAKEGRQQINRRQRRERRFPEVCADRVFASFVIFCLKSAAVHPLYEKADRLSQLVIGAAIEVHRHKGSGLIESIYERCLLHELELRSVPAATQKIVCVEYKGLVFDEPLRFDVLVDDCLLVELKAVETMHPSSKAQLFSYMKLLDIPIGLLINFHEPVLKNGIARMILPGANITEGNEGNEVCL
jgi:GxxExxY protein